MLRKLAVSLAVAGILGASQVNALGLGQIRINSALNEPLDAEIQLLQVRNLDPLQVLPKMADLDQFAMAGIDRSRLLSDVKFQVSINQNGTGSIRLTSSRPVREPFLNLLVEVNWPNGRLVREYTVLLDPPAFQASSVAGSAAPVLAPSVAAPVSSRPQPVVAAPARSRGPVNNIRTRANPQTQVFVERDDTLGKLAQRHSPGGGTNLNQMMLALQRKNPQAFPNSNINFLKAGVVLDLPSLSEVQALSAREASREVSRQMQSWKSGSSTSAPSAPQEDGSKKKPLAPADSQAPAATAASQGQLKILSAQDQNAAENAQDEAGATKVAESLVADPEKVELLRRNEELENQLAVTQESVDKIERDNTELNDKLTAISQQLETLQRLLELKDQQMAALQGQLQQVQVAPAAAPVEPPAPKGPSGLVETVLNTPAYMAAAGAVLGGLLVGLFALGRRRRDDTDSVPNEQLVESRADNLADSTLAAAGVATVVAAGAMAIEDEKAPDHENAATASADLHADESAGSDFDLDMDLDLDLSDDNGRLTQDTGAHSQTVKRPDFGDDEFDLSLDGDFEEDMPPKSQVGHVQGDDFDESLDDLLGVGMGDEAEAQRANLRSGMGQLESEVEVFDEPEDTLESLGLNSVIASSTDTDASEDEVSDTHPADPVEASGDDEADDALSFRLNRVAAIDPSQDIELLDAAGADRVPASEADAGAQSETVEYTQPTLAEVEQPEAAPTAVASATDESLDFALDEILDFPDQDEDVAPESVAAIVDETPGAVSPAIDAADVQDAEIDDLDALLAESIGDSGDDDEINLDASDEDDLNALLAQNIGDSAKDDEIALDESDEDDLNALLAQGSGDSAEDDEITLEASDAGEFDALLAQGSGDSAEDDEITLEASDAGEFDALLAQGSGDSAEDDEITLDESDEDDLDAMLAALEKDSNVGADQLNLDETVLSDESSEDLDTSFGDDMDLDTELEALLGSVDDEIALEESGADDEDRGFEDMGFLEGTDEIETKLDLARAYIDMEDEDGAKDILSEILQQGSNTQQQEARKLMETLT